jgi:DNA-binding PadR family transcriptional regulator
MKQAFLALLAERPQHGYELKLGYERRFAPVVPALNAGQVYTTLARLERGGLVRGSDAAVGGRQKRTYELTEAGRKALEDWLATPATARRLRDDFFLKLVLAGSSPAEAQALIERQRRAYLQELRDVTSVSPGDNHVAALLLEGVALHVEADLEWLDLCEQRLAREEA